MIGLRGPQPIVFGLQHRTGAHLFHKEGEARPAHQALGVPQQLIQASGAEQQQRLLAAEQAIGLEQSRQPKVVIAVKVGQKDRVDTGQAHRPHELPLRALPAIDENALAPADEQHGRRAAVDCRSGPGGTEEHKL